MNLNQELKLYVETRILPRYKDFGLSHGFKHVRRVIANSLSLAEGPASEMGEKLDINMVYAIAAYHDLGMIGPRELHHITSGKILMEDAALRQWFTPEQLLVMKEAIEDHRASSDHAPRSIYGRIVAEADRDLEPEEVFRRAVEFGIEKYPEYDKEEQWKRFAKHMDEKYGPKGYLKLWIHGSPNERYQKQLHEIIADRPRLRQIFDRYYDYLTENWWD